MIGTWLVAIGLLNAPADYFRPCIEKIHIHPVSQAAWLEVDAWFRGIEEIQEANRQGQNIHVLHRKFDGWSKNQVWQLERFLNSMSSTSPPMTLLRARDVVRWHGRG